MNPDHGLSFTLVDELEALGARFDFFLNDQDKIVFTWICKGVARFQRCRQILQIGLASSEFGAVFRDEIEDRYLAGRMRMFDSDEDEDCA